MSNDQTPATYEFEPKTFGFSIHMSPHLREALLKRAKELRKPMPRLVRELIEREVIRAS